MPAQAPTLEAPAPELRAVEVRAVASPSGLNAIAEPGVAVAIWRRAPIPDLGPWLDALAPQRLPRMRALVRPAGAADAVREACIASGTPESAERAALIADVAGLAAAFAQIARAAALRLRLDVIDTDGCRRFHVDNVALRLLCAYRGAGTEYGRAGPDGPDGAPEAVARASRFAPAIFRGLLWPGAPTGIVHRSPPILGTGETRLLLVIDPA